MSNLHFPGSEESAKRIIQLGELPENVFNVGDTSVESCLTTKYLSKEEIACMFPNKEMIENYSIVTFHPVTLESNTSEEQVYQLIKAMDKIEGMNYFLMQIQVEELLTRFGRKRLKIEIIGLLQCL